VPGEGAGAEVTSKRIRYLPMTELKTIPGSARKSLRSSPRLLRQSLAGKTAMNECAPDRGALRRVENRSEELRKTGLPAIGNVPWGSHFCIFYETKEDLRNILVPYFKAGLENNELCVSYVGSHEFITVKDAKDAIRKEIPKFDRLTRDGQIEIVAREKWFGKNGDVTTAKAIARYQKKLDRALKQGFSGLRLHGSSAWLRVGLHEGGFRRYEQALDSMMAGQRMIVACTFPLMLTGAEQILDAVRTHEFAVTLRKGLWKLVEIGDIESAKREARRTDPTLEQLTFRQREILQLIAEGQNTKQIADLLEISVKTVEAHRLQLMERLRIHDVAGLVRFAIRTGLVSAEA
jgi:DNA-binding CsgD family transcriptional regulator